MLDHDNSYATLAIHMYLYIYIHINITTCFWTMLVYRLTYQNGCCPLCSR